MEFLISSLSYLPLIVCLVFYAEELIFTQSSFNHSFIIHSLIDLCITLIHSVVQDYQKKQKEHEELLKWTGNMTSLDLIEIYNGDPSQYFYDKVSSPCFSLEAFTRPSNHIVIFIWLPITYAV